MKNSLFVMAAFCAILSACAEMFRDGDRVAFVGDSITHMGYYVRIISDYYVTRFPDKDIKFFQIGQGGSRAKHCLQWCQQMVVSKKPNVVAVMFGMNDVGRKDYVAQPSQEQVESQKKSLDEYARSMRELTRLIDAKLGNPRRYFLTPTPYFDAADKRAGTQNQMGVNAGLAAASAIVRDEWREHGGTLVDFNAAYNSFFREWRGSDDRQITGWDRIHPLEGGHLLMAYWFLKAQNADRIVSDIRLHGNRVVCAINADVTDLAATNGYVSFTVLEKALPMPFLPGDSAKVQKMLPLAEELNQEVLTFYPPQDGEWLLKIDGRDIVKASEKKWIKGINIAFNEKTPQFEQAQRVAEANKTFRDLVRSVQSTWKGQENFIRLELKKRAEDPVARAELIARLPSNRQKQFSFILENWDHKVVLEEKAIEGGAEIRKLAKPCPHRYELVLINK